MVVCQFGSDVLTEMRFIHILSDYRVFGSLPAIKKILKDMILNGHCQTICDLGNTGKTYFFPGTSKPVFKPEGDEWKIKLASLATSIVRQSGFDKSLVVYVIDCITYAMGWTDVDPVAPQLSQYASVTAGSANLKPLPRPMPARSNANMTANSSYQNIVETQFVMMKVTPVNAEISIDGAQQQVANGIVAVELPVGSHMYEVKAPMYKSQNGSFLLSADEKTELDVTLKLDGQMVKVIVSAEDSDAELYINGRLSGKGKWEGLVEVGAIEVECCKPKFYSLKKTMNIGSRKQESIRVPALKPICGNLKINVKPYGSEIFINGESKGLTPLLVKNIQIGERIVRVLTNEGTEWITHVGVQEGQLTDVNHSIPTLFMDDYSQVRIGDYFYEDGTFSHEMAKGKEIVGMVFSRETSIEEKEHGWTHGQIVALQDVTNHLVRISSWGVPLESLLRFAIHDIKDISNCRDYGYKSNHLDCLENNKDFSPFYLAATYKKKLPFGKTSGWYLPSICQWKELYKNTYQDWDRIWHFLNILGSKGIKDYATSTLKNKMEAWYYCMGYSDIFEDRAYQSKAINSDWMSINIRCVASF